MLAPFAHHLKSHNHRSIKVNVQFVNAFYLSTPGVPLDGHTAHGAPLDVVVAVVRKEERIHWLPSTFHLVINMTVKTLIKKMTMITKAAPCSAQESPGCHVAEQRLQNSLSHVGQDTGTPWNDYLKDGTSRNNLVWLTLLSNPFAHVVRSLGLDVDN